jgi:hypothetical protein
MANDRGGDDNITVIAINIKRINGNPGIIGSISNYIQGILGFSSKK